MLVEVVVGVFSDFKVLEVLKSVPILTCHPLRFQI